MIEIIREPCKLRPLAGGWNDLAASFPNPLLRYEWHLACAEAFCLPGDLIFVLVRRGHEITAIAPLVRARTRGIDVLQFLGDSTLSETCGFLYRDSEALEELLDALIGLGRPLILRRLSHDLPEVNALRRLCPGRAIALVRPCAGSPVLPLHGTWKDLEAAMGPRHRQGLRRAMRRAETSGPVTSDLVRPSPEEVPGLFAEIVRVEASGWKGRAGTAMLYSEGLTRFFNAYALAAAELGILRLRFMRIGGRLVAFQLAVEYARRLWLLKIGYDEQWSRCSPGILLTHLSIRAAYERGLEAYEFLGSEEPWIRTWTGQVRPQVTLRVYPFAAHAVLGLAMELPRFLLRPRKEERATG